MKSVDEALAVMMPAFTPRGVERVGLHDALGLHVADAVVARFASPAFANSSMDGYAVRAGDVAGASSSAPRTLPLFGSSRAGGPTPPSLPPGAAMRIFTGAPLPPGADAVVMQEDTSVDGDRVAIREAVQAGAFVRAEGSDLVRGATMLPRGARLGPGEIGLLASQGNAAVTAHRRPRVAILSTGDELRDISEPDRPGSIVNSNAYAIAAQVREAGGVPWVLPNVPDDLAATVTALGDALAADVVITCGGVSVGEHDFVKDAFAKIGVEAAFWKVRIKPGKPLSFGLRGATPVIGLPGNPISAMVTFEALVRPGLRAMLGDPRPYRARHVVFLGADHEHGTGRLELARASLASVEGRTIATLHRLQGSGSLPSWVGVDALLLLAEDRATFRAGDRVAAILLRDETGSARSPFADTLPID